MRKFLNHLLFFLFYPFVIILLVEGCISYFKNNFFDENKLENIFSVTGNTYHWVNEIKYNNKVLLTGSSTVKYGLSCNLLNKLSKEQLAFVNLAADARDPIATYFLLKEIDLTGTKAVYFGLDPWIYSKSYYKNRDPYLYLDLNFFQCFSYATEHDPFTFKKRYKSFIKFLTGKKNSPLPLNNQIPFDYGSGKLIDNPSNFRETINKRFQLEKYDWSYLQFVYLRKIADYCKQLNISFIVFIPPKRSDFSATYKLHCKLIQREFVDHLIAEPFRVPVLGKFDDLDTKGDSILFADAYHLNYKGQAVYSAIFFQMISQQPTQLFDADYSWFIKQ